MSFIICIFLYLSDHLYGCLSSVFLNGFCSPSFSPFSAFHSSSVSFFAYLIICMAVFHLLSLIICIFLCLSDHLHGCLSSILLKGFCFPSFSPFSAFKSSSVPFSAYLIMCCQSNFYFCLTFLERDSISFLHYWKTQILTSFIDKTIEKSASENRFPLRKEL